MSSVLRSAPPESLPARPLRVAMVNLTGGGLSGGYRKYLAEMVPRLRADARIERLTVLVPPDVPGAELEGVAPVEQWERADRRMGYRGLRARIARLAPDVVFVPVARWLDCGRRPTVVMLQNMEPLVVPFGGNSLADSALNLARLGSTRRSVRRATRVIAISGFVRDFLVERWRIAPAKVGMVYHGVAPEPTPVLPPSVAALAGRPFLFTAGSIRPARGLEDLIDAAAELRTRGPAPAVVIAGEASPAARGYERRMRQRARAAGIEDAVIWAGQLSPAEIGGCFLNCAAYVMTSRVEACPNTALEAMSHGALSVAADNAPLPEIFGPAALYYAPGNGGALADAVQRLLALPAAEGARRRQVARERAASFSWSATAAGTVRELVASVVGAASRTHLHLPGMPS